MKHGLQLSHMPADLIIASRSNMPGLASAWLIAA